jgi:metal-responsive CopG/Arc/MetJ family transcriptional regulator
MFEVITMGELKNKERIGTSLPTELVKDLKDYSEKTMIPISKIIEKAIEEYLKSTK